MLSEQQSIQSLAATHALWKTKNEGPVQKNGSNTNGNMASHYAPSASSSQSHSLHMHIIT